MAYRIHKSEKVQHNILSGFYATTALVAIATACFIEGDLINRLQHGESFVASKALWVDAGWIIGPTILSAFLAHWALVHKIGATTGVMDFDK